MASEYFQSDRMSSEYEAMLDAAESQGFSDGLQGKKCLPRSYQFFGCAATVYGSGYKYGKALRLSFDSKE